MSDPYGQQPAEANHPPTWPPPAVDDAGNPYGDANSRAAGYPPPGAARYGAPPYGTPPYGAPAGAQAPAGYPQPAPPATPGYPPPGQTYGTPGPGYGAPPGAPYGAPYGTAQPGPGGYAAAQPTYQMPTYPGAPAGYPQPPRSRARGGLIALVIGLVLLLAGGVTTAVILVNRTGEAPEAIAPAHSPASSRPTPSESPTPAAPTVSFTAPAQIGTLRKASDQSQVDQMRQLMKNSGLTDPFAVMYEDSAAAGRRVITWGGAGSAIGMLDQQEILDLFFGSTAKQLSIGTVGARTKVDPGAVGGRAECAPVTGGGLSMAICAWAGDAALLGFIFTGASASQSGTQVRAMLAAIVVKK